MLRDSARRVMMQVVMVFRREREVRARACSLIDMGAHRGGLGLRWCLGRVIVRRDCSCGWVETLRVD